MQHRKMATPDNEPARAYARIQAAADRRVVAILQSALSDIDDQLKALERRVGIGNAVQRTQLQASRLAILRRLQKAWLSLGDEVERAALDAAVAAAESQGKFDADFLRRAGLDRTQRNTFQRALEAVARNAVGLALGRDSRTRHTLSSRVYNSNVLVSGQVERKIQSALARNLTAKQFADEVRQYVNPNTAGGASYAAKRLARTEINNAFHHAAISTAADKPWVTGMQWHLSRSHKVPDRCDELNGQVFDKSDVPDKPHPQCFCFVTPELLSDAAFEQQLLNGDFSAYLQNRIRGAEAA
jgi:SPP1 gp7 family putative phage head morphogenesis protein